MKRILIVEDEIPASQWLTRLLASVAPDFEIAGYCDSIESAVNFFVNSPAPDLVLLDIQLGDGLCFEIFRQVDVKCPVIFTTAYDAYIFRAFELNSVDYLLKPVNEDSLAGGIAKYRKYHEQLIPDREVMATLLSRDRSLYKQRFLVSSGASLISVATSEAAYFYAVEKFVFMVTLTGKSYPVDFSLDKLEGLLPEKDFFRINRQFLVAFPSIRRISVLSKSRMKIILEPEYSGDVFVSNARSHEFRLWLDR